MGKRVFRSVVPAQRLAEAENENFHAHTLIIKYPAKAESFAGMGVFTSSVCQHFLNGGFQFWQVALDNIPDHL